jgi:hypothetical protein
MMITSSGLLSLVMCAAFLQQAGGLDVNFISTGIAQVESQSIPPSRPEVVYQTPNQSAVAKKG